MPEYATTIEAWFNAGNIADATATAKRLRERVNEHPCVVLVEVQHPEETED